MFNIGFEQETSEWKSYKAKIPPKQIIAEIDNKNQQILVKETLSNQELEDEELEILNKSIDEDCAIDY